MEHLNCEASLYRHDPHFARTATIFFVHNNGQDYQFKLEHDQNGVELLDNLGLPSKDYAWFLDPHYPELMNFTAAAIRHAHFVGTVSPGQKDDFLRSDNKGGGEGLRHLFLEKDAQGRLFAITNGIPLEVRQKAWLGFSFKEINRHDPAAVKEALDKIKDLQKEARQKIATQHPDFFPFSNGTSPYLTDEQYFVVTMVTRITEQKGVQYVASFVRQAIHSGKKVMFLFVGAGDGRLMDELKALAQEFPGLVGYPGRFVSDQEPIYYHMYLAGDLYLAFSAWEPGGISPMEALAFLTAVLASDKQGHKSTVKSLYVDALKDLLGVEADELGVNGARFPIDDWSFDNTVNNAYQAFEVLFAAWKNRFVDNKWDEILENAFFSDNSWERVVGDFERLFKNIRTLGRVSSSNIAFAGNHSFADAFKAWQELQEVRLRIFTMRMPQIAQSIRDSIFWIQRYRQSFTEEEMAMVRQNPIASLKWLSRKGISYYQFNEAKERYSRDILDKLKYENEITALFKDFSQNKQRELIRKYSQAG